MFLIPVSIRCSITWLASFHFLRNCLIICVDNIRHRHLLAVILELEYILCFLGHPDNLLTIDDNAIYLMLCKHLFCAKTL